MSEGKVTASTEDVGIPGAYRLPPDQQDLDEEAARRECQYLILLSVNSALIHQTQEKCSKARSIASDLLNARLRNIKCVPPPEANVGGDCGNPGLIDLYPHIPGIQTVDYIPAEYCEFSASIAADNLDTEFDGDSWICKIKTGTVSARAYGTGQCGWVGTP
jgi:hypothetical protein